MQVEGSALANNYTGPTAINEGTVVAFKSAGTNAFGSGVATNTLTIGDGIGGARADKLVLRNSNQIADTTEVSVSISGQLDLQTFNTNETIASLSGAGSVDLGPGSLLTINGATSTLYTGSIFGGGGIAKGGAGNLEMSGVSDVAAGTTVSGTGKLLVSGSLGGLVNVTAGTLGGTGTILGPVSVSSGANLSPGASPGRLNTGSLLLSPGANFLWEATSATPATGYDQVGVTGTVSLNQSNFVMTLGFTPVLNNVFALILNDGSDLVTGTFAGLPEGAPVFLNGTTGFITYTGNFDGGLLGNDVLIVVPEPGAVVSLLGGLGTLVGLQRFRRRKS
jgi:uncharacterized protein with beta-barrel porin domain